MCEAKVLKSGAIVITVPAAMLKSAFQKCPDLERHEDAGVLRPKVRDVKSLAIAVASSLNSEGEAGLNSIQRMFDQAFIEAAEDGAAGVSLPGDDDYGPRQYL